MGWRSDNEVQQMLRESAKGYFADQGGPAHQRAVLASDSGFDPGAWKAMAELGWTGILLPESVGGSELGLEPALTLAEEFGAALAPEPYAASAIMAGTVLARASASSAGTAVLEALVNGDSAVTLAWQEQRGTPVPGPFSTRLRGGTLEGTKIFVPGWIGCGQTIIAAQEDGAGTVLILLKSDTPGLEASVQRMTDGTDTATLALNQITVGDDAILLRGTEADAALDLALARGTLTLCAQLEGLASGLWGMTADYLKQRVQFEQPLADFQAVRHRMVELHADIELAAASWRKALMALEARGPSDPGIAAAKARCSDAALQMARWGVQFHGAFGYTTEADVGLYLNTALRWASWLGNGAAQRQRAYARHRGKE